MFAIGVVVVVVCGVCPGGCGAVHVVIGVGVVD